MVLLCLFTGATLIISPWNYPIFLGLAPLVGAIAAGCTAILKPSELSAHSSKILTELFDKYLDTSAYMVVNGAVAETTLLLESKWDHIFYTGNGAVAKIIMKSAVKNLTSLTLELGGKSPCIIDENCNLAVAAKRVAFGKSFNAGQVKGQIFSKKKKKTTYFACTQSNHFFCGPGTFNDCRID